MEISQLEWECHDLSKFYWKKISYEEQNTSFKDLGKRESKVPGYNQNLSLLRNIWFSFLL
jgi:hypothetical protein